MESDLVKRMDLREVLKDDRLAAQITPTMSLVEQLLHDKTNLSGPALANARRLIKKYVDELAAVLKKQVYSTKSGEIDRSVPPKRVYRNLDLKRTVWKNLHHFNPDDRRVYVDQLFYRHTAQKSLNKYLIVVVDQSGSMVSSMVQCAILASIFATLPRIVVSLVAFDTNVIDLTPWVADPFESLMRTNLGGGNDGPKAMEYARTLMADPRRTTMVWISDFFECPQRPAAVRDDQGRQAVGRALHPRRLGQRQGVFQRQRVVPGATQGDRSARADRQHQEPDPRAEEAIELTILEESRHGQGEIGRCGRGPGRLLPRRSSASRPRSSMPMSSNGSGRSTRGRDHRAGDCRRGWSGSSSSARRRRTSSSVRSSRSSSATPGRSSARS